MGELNRGDYKLKYIAVVKYMFYVIKSIVVNIKKLN